MVFQNPVEFLLSLSSAFFDCRYQILFMSVTQVSCNVRILQWLERGECCGCIEIRNGGGKCGCVNVSLGQEVVPVIRTQAGETG